jgi:hypothetical protein
MWFCMITSGLGFLVHCSLIFAHVLHNGLCSDG